MNVACLPFFGSMLYTFIYICKLICHYLCYFYQLNINCHCFSSRFKFQSRYFSCIKYWPSRRLALLVDILTNKFCSSAVVPTLQSIWFYNTQSDVWYEHFLTKRSRNNNPSSLIIIWQGKTERSDWFFLGRNFTIRTVPRKRSMPCIFFIFKSRQIYFQFKLQKENMYNTTKKRTMNQLIVRQMKAFSDSLPASELEHLWRNMFNYCGKYICVHAFKLNELWRKRTRQ